MKKTKLKYMDLSNENVRKWLFGINIDSFNNSESECDNMASEFIKAAEQIPKLYAEMEQLYNNKNIKQN